MLRSRRELHHSNRITEHESLQLTSATKSAQSGHSDARQLNVRFRGQSGHRNLRVSRPLLTESGDCRTLSISPFEPRYDALPNSEDAHEAARVHLLCFVVRRRGVARSRHVRSNLSGSDVSACYSPRPHLHDAERQAYLAGVSAGIGTIGSGPTAAIFKLTTSNPSGNAADTRKYATELVALTPDLIFTIGSASMPPLLQATRSVPIVFALVADPVGAGFVNSLARPGGNATGFISVEYTFGGKWLELLKEIAPSVTHVVVIQDPADPAGIGVFSAVQSAASLVRVELSSARRSRCRRDGSRD